MQEGGIRLTGKSDAQPLVSVICVTYNAAGHLPGLIASVKAHKTAEVEFVIMDGESKDGTIKLLEANADIVDYWRSEGDKGIYDAMNKAVNYCKGKWVIFLGADDTLMDGFNPMLRLLKDAHTIYYGNVIFYGKEFLKLYDDYYLTKLNICHQGIFYPKAVFQKYQYDLQYQVYADYDLNLRCWKDPGFKFVHADHTIASFPEGGFSSTTKDLVFEKNRDILFKKYLKRGSYYRYLNRTLGFWGMLKRFVHNT